MRKFVILVAGLAFMCAGSLRADAGTVSLTLHNGLVTIDAKDASVRQIIVEWQKVGRTLFIDADRLTGPPITLQLTDVPERQALDLILKSAAGYMAAPRSALIPNASVYDRVFVLASSVAPPEPPPGAVRRAPVVLYPSENPNETQRRIPVFRPRFPTRPSANGDQDNASDDDDGDDAQTPEASPTVTAPVTTSQPGLVVVPAKKKPDGGSQ